jgi:hypothetical protein
MMFESELDREVKPRRLSGEQLTEWWKSEHPDRRWAVQANRSLSFRKVNRLLNDRPPVVTLRTGYNVFLLKSGSDRDLFIEHFHRGYEARVDGASA